MRRFIGIAFLVSTFFLVGVLSYSHHSNYIETVVFAAADACPAQPELLSNNLSTLLDKSNQDPAVREHAWNLLQQLVKGMPNDPLEPNLTPPWENWDTKCILGLERHCVPTKRAEPALQVRSDSDPQTPQGNNPPFATVYYNCQASAWIRNKHLNTSSDLIKMFDATGRTTQSPLLAVPAADPGAIVVKEVWQGVNFDYTTRQWVIKVFDSSDLRGNPKQLGADVSGWKHMVRFKTLADGTPDQTQACDFNADVRTYSKEQDAADVPVNCFVHRFAPVQCQNLVTFAVHPRLGNSSLSLDSPCLMVLMGVQIITKEDLSNWSWNTFWWANKPTHPASTNASLRGTVFQHFDMDTFLPESTDLTHSHLPNIYNPYLEGVTPNGTRSNCAGCHFKASYVPRQLPLVQTGSCSTAGARKAKRDGMLDVFLFLNKPIIPVTVAQDCLPNLLGAPIVNHCRLRTSLLWSLATNQDCNSNFPE